MKCRQARTHLTEAPAALPWVMVDHRLRVKRFLTPRRQDETFEWVGQHQGGRTGLSMGDSEHSGARGLHKEGAGGSRRSPRMPVQPHGWLHVRRAALLCLASVLAIAAAALPAEQPPALGLSECVQYALRHNPLVLSAAAQARANGGRVVQVEAGWRPQLSTSVGYSDSQPAPNNLRNYAATFSVSKLLWDSGRTAAQVAEARWQRDAAEQARRGVEREVAAATAKAYFNVLKARELVSAAREEVANAERHRAMADAKYDEGTVARADVIRAEVQVAANRLALVKAQTDEENALADLRNAMGWEAGAPLDVRELDVKLPAAPELPRALQVAYEHRPEIRQVEASVAAAKAGLRAARTTAKPEVNLRGEWGARENTFFPTENAWAVGLTLSRVLWDGGETRGRVTESAARLDAARADRDVVRQRVGLEVTHAALALSEARERLHLANEEVRLARHSLRLAEGRYRVAAASLVEVTDAQTALTQALGEVARARYDSRVAHIDLLKSMGFLPTEEAPAQ